MTARATFWRRPWATAAAVIGFVMLAIYIGLILTEGNDSFGVVIPWAVLMAVAASLAGSGALLDDDQQARRLLFVSAFVFLGIGALAILSIGLGFLAAAVAALFAAGRIPRPS